MPCICLKYNILKVLFCILWETSGGPFSVKLNKEFMHKVQNVSRHGLGTGGRVEFLVAPYRDQSWVQYYLSSTSMLLSPCLQYNQRLANLLVTHMVLRKMIRKGV